MSYLRILPLGAFEMTTGALDEMSMYQFHNKICNHYFCPTCGTQIALTLESKKTMSVNVRCVDGIDFTKLKFWVVDGKSLP